MRKILLMICLCFFAVMGAWGCAALRTENYAAYGDRAFTDKQYSEAIVNYRAALNEDPLNEDILGMLGWSYFLMQDYDNAQGVFEKLKDLSPENLDGLTGLGWSYMKLGDLDTAEIYFNDAVIVENRASTGGLKKGIKIVGLGTSRFADAYDGLGWVAQLRGDYESSKNNFLKARRKNLDNAESYRGMGYLYFSKGEYWKAEKELKRAYKLRNDWKDVQELMEKCRALQKGRKKIVRGKEIKAAPPEIKDVWGLYNTGHFSKALEGFKKLAKKNKRSFEVYNGIGWSHLKLAHYEKADKAFKRSLKLLPDNRSALDGIAGIRTMKYEGSDIAWGYYNRGNFDEAVRAFRRVLHDKDSLYPEAEKWKLKSGIAWSLYFKGDYEGAEIKFKRALETKNNSARFDGRKGLGFIAFKKEDYYRTVEELEESDPKDSDARTTLAWGYYLSKDYKNSKREFERATESNPLLVIPRTGLAWSYYKLGEIEEANGEFIEAIEISPVYVDTGDFRKLLEEEKGMISLWSVLGWSYYNKGLTVPALEVFEKAVNILNDKLEVSVGLASVYLYQKRYMEAARLLEATLEAKEDERGRWTKVSDGYMALGWSYYYMEDFESAVSIFSRLLGDDEKFDKYAAPHIGLGWAYYKKGLLYLARKEFVRALEFSPEDKSALEGKKIVEGTIE